MLTDANQSYTQADIITSQIDDILNDSILTNDINILRNNMLFCRTIKTNLDLYEMKLSQSVTKILEK